MLLVESIPNPMINQPGNYLSLPSQKEHFIILYPCTKCRQTKKDSRSTPRKEMAHFNHKPNEYHMGSGIPQLRDGKSALTFFSRQVASDQENCITPRWHQRLQGFHFRFFMKSSKEALKKSAVHYTCSWREKNISTKSPTGEFFLHFGQQKKKFPLY